MPRIHPDHITDRIAVAGDPITETCPVCRAVITVDGAMKPRECGHPVQYVAEFRTANTEQAAALFERLQALAEELGVELTTAPWVDADAYDAPELAGSLP